jgi:hypothetical protein
MACDDVLAAEHCADPFYGKIPADSKLVCANGSLGRDSENI